MKKKNDKKNSPEMKKTAPSMPGGWILSVCSPLTVRELKEMLPAEADVEIWPEAGVLEVALEGNEYMDIEELELEAQPEETLAELRREGVRALYYVSFKPALYEKALPFLKCLAAKCQRPILPDTDSDIPAIEA